METKVAHLRNLLTPIKNYLALLEKKVNTKPSHVSEITVLEKLIEKEILKLKEVMPEVFELIDQLPEDCLGFVEE